MLELKVLELPRTGCDAGGGGSEGEAGRTGAEEEDEPPDFAAAPKASDGILGGNAGGTSLSDVGLVRGVAGGGTLRFEAERARAAPELLWPPLG